MNRRRRRPSNTEERREEAKQDSALVDQVRRGDEQAFRRLVERHHRRAFAIAVALVRDEQDALEVVQEAFLKVHRGLHRFHGGSSFFTWLYRIVTNVAIDHMRKPARRDAELTEAHGFSGVAPLVSGGDVGDPSWAARQSELRQRIERELAALPPSHRGVIMMREVEGMSYEEMADAMQVSKGTIMSRLFHARQKLQRALADCYVEQFGELPQGREARR
jgi:RNA polymerase sigma-70 factor (ECF subfamily)